MKIPSEEVEYLSFKQENPHAHNTCRWTKKTPLLQHLSLNQEKHNATLVDEPKNPHAITLVIEPRKPQSTTLVIEPRKTPCYNTCHLTKTIPLLQHLSTKKDRHHATTLVIEPRKNPCYNTCHWTTKIPMLKYLSLNQNNPLATTLVN